MAVITDSKPSKPSKPSDAPKSSAGSTPRKLSSSNYTFPSLQRHAFLEPPHAYLIRSTTYNRFLILAPNNVLTLSTETDLGARWQCVDRNNDGHLGLRNERSGTFLGHDIIDNVVCEATRHKGWESIVPEAKEGGTFVMVMPHWWMRCPIGVRREDVEEEDGDGIEEVFELDWLNRKEEGEKWEFLRID